MKKLLILFLILTLVCSCVLFVACGNDTETNAESETETAPVEPTGLESAAEYVRQLYKDMTLTASDYKLESAVAIAGVRYTIAWTVTTDQITLTTGEDGKVTADVLPEEPLADIPYTLKATISDAEGNTLVKEFSLTIPKFAVMTAEQYYAAEAGDAVVVDGVVTAIVSKSRDASYNCVFVQDLEGKGGYYAYGMADDPVALGIEIGMTVRIKGVKDIYNGTHEVKEAGVTIANAEKVEVTPIDLTEAYLAAENLKAESLVGMQGALAIVKGVQINEAGDNGYYHFTLGEHKSYVRISGSTCPMTKAEQEDFKTIHANNYGAVADVVGIITIYDGKFYLTPVTPDAFSNIKEPERNDAEKVQFELDALTFVDSISADGVIDLVVAGGKYTDVVFTWASNLEAAVVADNKLTVKVPDAETVLTLTVTATLNGETGTKSFEVKLSKTLTSLKELVELGAAQAHNTYTSDKYLAAGVIIDIANTQYGNMTIRDGSGNTLYIYGTWNADGTAKYGEMENAPVVGDYIVVFGAVGQYNNAPQMKNGWILSSVSGTSISDAAALGASKDHNTYTDDKYIIAGVITSLQNSTYGNMVITDEEGNSILVYGTYGFDGKARYDALTVKPVEGDFVVIYGILGQYNGTAQMKNGWIVDYVAGTGDDSETESDAPADTEAPAVSDTEAPVVSDTEAPAVSDTEAPAVSDTEAPVVSDTEAPAVSDTEAPVVSDTEAPVVSDTEAPVVSDTEAPAVTDTEAPAETETESTAPAETETDAPAETESETDAPVVDDGMMTIEEVLAAADDTNVKFSGIVVGYYQAYNSQFDNVSVYVIDENGDKILVYRLTGNVDINDVIVVTGKVTTYNGARQIAQGGTYEKIGTHTCTFSDATCTVLATCTVCGATTGELADHNFEGGVCTVCGGTESITIVDVVIGEYAAANGWSDATQYAKLVMDSNITVTATGGGNTGKYYNNGLNWRIYQNESPSIVVSAANGKTIKSVKITYDINKTGILTLNGTNVTSGTVVEVNASSVTFSVGNTNPDVPNGQVRITAIEVIYE